MTEELKIKFELILSEAGLPVNEFTLGVLYGVYTQGVNARPRRLREVSHEEAATACRIYGFSTNSSRRAFKMGADYQLAVIKNQIKEYALAQ